MRLLLGALLTMLTSELQAETGKSAEKTPAKEENSRGAPAHHETSAQDRLFLQLAAMSGLAEVKFGELARSKGQNSAVKEFAASMVSDHEKANDKLATLAKAAGVDLPDRLGLRHDAIYKQLKDADPDRFDLAYIRGQLEEHQKTATLLIWELGSGQDKQLQHFAAETLPAVLNHLKKAQDLATQLGQVAKE
jgi:putative membrane protein